jgi:hypothetical protein
LTASTVTLDDFVESMAVPTAVMTFSRGSSSCALALVSRGSWVGAARETLEAKHRREALHHLDGLGLHFLDRRQ